MRMWKILEMGIQMGLVFDRAYVLGHSVGIWSGAIWTGCLHEQHQVFQLVIPDILQLLDC